MADYVTYSRGVDHLGFIRTILGDLQGPQAVVSELIQNADDAIGATLMRFVVSSEALEVWNDGEFQRCEDLGAGQCPWLESRRHRCDFHSFRAVAGGDKRSRSGATGAFGVGFTAVYQLTDQPELLSSGEHWIIDEAADERDRIRSVPSSADHTGTTFRLPWALDHSDFRRRIGQDVMTPAVIEGFPAMLAQLVPPAMLFLKQLSAIEVADGRRLRTFEREATSERVTIRDTGGPTREWHLLTGEFSETAAALVRGHPDLLDQNRSSQVAIALPLTEEYRSGVIYATLPTEETTHLPLAVNAAFFPASDRKRILLDDTPASAWNRAALRRAAGLLAEALESLPEAVGDSSLVQLLIEARELAGRCETSRIDPVFEEFWRALVSRLPSAQVVPTGCGGHRTPTVVRLWSHGEEEAAIDLMHVLGVELVCSAHRREWFMLQSTEVGVQPLVLGDVAAALRDKGVTSAWCPEDRAGPIRSDDALATLWSLLDRLLTVQGKSSEDSRRALRDCAVGPGWDGRIWPLHALHQTDQESQDLFADLGLDAIFIDVGRLSSSAPALVALVESATPQLVIDWLEALFDDGGEPDHADRVRILRWLHGRREGLSSTDVARMAELPIYPTAAGCEPLTELALPGDFADPLGLAQMVVLDGIEDVKSFLVRLGARGLSLSRYCMDYVPAAVETGDLSDEQLRGLVGLLAERLPEIHDNEQVRSALRGLPLVPCTDGVRRPGEDVYLTPEVKTVVGPGAPVAELPGHHVSAHRELFRWLGTVDEPRAADVIARAHRLAAAPANHRDAAVAIIRHISQRLKADPGSTERNLAELRTTSWLPAEGQRQRAYRPEQVFSAFSRNIFASQGTFLDVPITDQRDASEVLTWLGIRSNPEPHQVVEHLLWCADRGEPVAENLWQYLNTHADDPALEALHGRRCLLIADTEEYVRPADVYWGSHPFGRFRHQLGDGFSAYQPFLQRLGVAERPSPDHAIEVLRDVAAHHGGEEAPLLDDDLHVVEACWRLLSDGLSDGEIEPDDLAGLHRDEVVLDPRGWLRRPVDVLFRDFGRLARLFGDSLSGMLIDRPEGQWRALHAAGVGDLSGEITTHIVEQGTEVASDVLAQRLRHRHRHLMRILDSHEPQASAALERLGSTVALQAVSHLTIQQHLELGERQFTSEPHDRAALYGVHDDHQVLLHVVRGGDPDWTQIAAEVVRALGVDPSHASSTAAAIKGVLAAATDQDAADELDELGFAELDDAQFVEAEPRVASGFGATPETATDTEPARPADPEGHDTDRTEPSTKPSPTTPAGDPSRGGDTPGRPSRAQPAIDRQRPRPAQSQSRLRSYVSPAYERSTNSEQRSDDEDDAVERAGVDAVLAYERRYGRTATEEPPGHPGYDIRSEEPDGRVRYIEVKSTADAWGQRGVALSSTQFAKARAEGDDFWLYVVDNALTAPRVSAINDPAGKVDQYVFDGGWHVTAETPELPRSGLPALRLPARPDHVNGAVPLVSIGTEGREVVGWLDLAEPRRSDDWFAVRIEGETLGLAYHGGVAVIEPTEGATDDDQLVLVSLYEQTDPATGEHVTLRRWRPDRAPDGEMLALRLWSDGSVEPLTVTHPDDVTVHGVVRSQLSLGDLEALGYLDAP